MNNPARQLDSTQVTPPIVKPVSGKSSSRLRVAQPVALLATDLHKSYRNGVNKVEVLRGIDVKIREGEFVAIVGSSGSGKSTLLHLLGTLDTPDQGDIWIGHQNVGSLRPVQRDRLRNREIGLIFQFYHLLPELTALENVLLPHMIGSSIFSYWKNRREYRKRAVELLEKVGLGHRMDHRPGQMSGGEMQRAAIARALIGRPGLLLADEPTGNLDCKNSDEVMQALMTMRDEENLTIVMVTHDNEIAQKANRTIRLFEGRVSA